MTLDSGFLFVALGTVIKFKDLQQSIIIPTLNVFPPNSVLETGVRLPSPFKRSGFAFAPRGGALSGGEARGGYPQSSLRFCRAKGESYVIKSNNSLMFDQSRIVGNYFLRIQKGNSLSASTFAPVSSTQSHSRKNVSQMAYQFQLLALPVRLGFRGPQPCPKVKTINKQ